MRSVPLRLPLLRSSRTRLRPLATIFTVIGAFLLICPPGAELAAQGGPIPVTSDPIPFPREDAELVDWLREQRAAIGDVRKVKSPDLEGVFRHVDSGVLGGEFHLTEFPTSPNRADVIALLTRLLYLNVDRHVAILDFTNKTEWGASLSQGELQMIRAEYQDRIVALIDEALALSPTGSVLAGLLETRGELQVRGRQPREAA